MRACHGYETISTRGSFSSIFVRDNLWKKLDARWNVQGHQERIVESRYHIGLEAIYESVVTLSRSNRRVHPPEMARDKEPKGLAN
jgi:hypothetical protein